MQSGTIFNVQRYSIHDGPGIRTTVFLKGCPLRCAWCHNPEGISSERELLVLAGRCLQCGECRRVCPHGGAASEDRAPSQCGLCGACVDICPAAARQMVGREIRVDQVLEIVMADRVFFEESGGGVTFSGGEPLAQPEFLEAALAACKGRELHTAVDTCGMGDPEALLAVARLTDLFLYDLKLMDEEKHRQYTGVSNRRILDNLQALAGVHRRIWIRVPLIPGINDDPAELEAIARYAAGIPAVRQVNVLPFHATGLHKARALGRNGTPLKLEPPSAETVSETIALFRSYGLSVKAGG